MMSWIDSAVAWQRVHGSKRCRSVGRWGVCFPYRNSIFPSAMTRSSRPVRGREILERIQSGQGTSEDLILLSDLGETMKTASLCALGGRAPYPVETAIEHFGDEFRQGAKFARPA